MTHVTDLLLVIIMPSGSLVRCLLGLMHHFAALVFVKCEHGLCQLMTATVGVYIGVVQVKPGFMFCHIRSHLESTESCRFGLDKDV
jgi:hypothetical protein